jgi:catechol 2,3-dioxygenase-like lactoylglutathione lyase family enzyme
MNFDHVSVSVSDLDRAVMFYQDQLGFETLPRPDFGFPGAWLQASGVPVHLTTGGTTRGPDAPLRPQDPHFAIAVTGDLDSFLDELRQQGVRVYELPNSPAAERQTFVMDPDGNVIELCVYAPSA